MLSLLTLHIEKLALIVLVAFAATATATAHQIICTTKLDQLKEPPELFGVRLGMTNEQVKEKLPLVQYGRADQFGVIKTSFNPHYDPRVDVNSFKSVRTISLDFLDGKLVTLWIGYDETFKWRRLDDFVLGFAQALNLPADWPVKRSARELTCDGFSAYASMIGGGPSLRISDKEAENVIGQRREEAAQALEAQVIGDLRTRTFYPTDCPNKDDIPPTSRVIFKNKAVAEENGFKLAKECQ